MYQLIFVGELVLIVGLALAIWEARRSRRLLRTIHREIHEMGQALTDMQAAIADEDSEIDQAIATLDTIPGLITAA
ncbi:MAG TPA: hypothetical protein VIJ94_10330, partial [Caulobacteraceae bacterium]